MDWLIQLAIAVAVQVVSYALTPKTKTASTSSVQEVANPTADAGKPIGVVFFRKTIKDPNCLAWMEKSTYEYQVKV